MIYTQEQELLLSLFLKKQKNGGVESVPDAIKMQKQMRYAMKSQIVSSL
jgi:hypothetical protein